MIKSILYSDKQQILWYDVFLICLAAEYSFMAERKYMNTVSTATAFSFATDRNYFLTDL